MRANKLEIFPHLPLNLPNRNTVLKRQHILFILYNWIDHETVPEGNEYPK